MNAPSWASTIADIERRVLWANVNEQIAPMRAARRRFLELQDLLQAAERHADPPAKEGALLGHACALRLAPSEPGGRIYSADIDEISACHRSDIGSMRAACGHLEQKSSSVRAIPGLSLLPAYPSEHDVEVEQSRLLRAHSRLLAELISEAELLSALCQHSKNHPIHDVARGLESYFGGLIDSLALKLRLVSAEMYQALYTPAVVQATARLRALLDARQASLAKEHAKLNERLAIYRDAGSEFQEIASAYARVLKETDHIRQDIARVSQL